MSDKDKELKREREKYSGWPAPSEPQADKPVRKAKAEKTEKPKDDNGDGN